MKKFKKFNSFLSICLSISVVLGNFSLPVFAFGENGINIEQVRTKTLSDDSGAILNKINSSSKQGVRFLSDPLMTKVEAKRKDYVEGEVLVKYKNNKINLQTGSGRATALNFIHSKSLEKKEDLGKINTSVLKIKDSKTVEEKIAELKNNPNVEYVEPNYLRYPQSINTNDAYKDYLWGLDNTGQAVNGLAGTADADIDAPEAWAINEGTNGQIIVAVIDTGVAYNHPDLVANMWDGTQCKDENGNALGGCNHGYDFTASPTDKTPLPTLSSHGTHVAGTIGAVKNNGKGVIGVSPNVKIMALKVDTVLGFSSTAIISAIDFSIQNGAKVINASYGGSSFSLSEFNAINRFKIAGGIFIASAGNESTNNENIHNYPSDYNLDNIISVAATNQYDNLATFSNYGATSIDVGAPGTNIYSTVADSSVMSESFDSVTTPNLPSGWTKGGVNNKWGTYDFLGDKVLYGQALSFPYDNNANSTVTSPIYNLGGVTNAASINFLARCDTEYTGHSTGLFYDYMTLEYSSDGTNFNEILNWDEPSLDWFNGDSSNIGAAIYQFKDRPIASNYLTNNFKFRFRWVTDSSLNYYDGCSVDDIQITKFTDGSDEQYGYKNGTSMAAPHVAGLAALVWGYKPGLNYTEVKNTILTTGNATPSLTGKTVTGKRINVYNALNSLLEKKPPYAVAIDNQKNARPISGINEADVVYEFPVEGSITRFMAIYNPNSGIAPSVKIGPVRSARPYFARTASEHNAIYTHAGGTADALQKLANHEYKIYNLDALTTEGGAYFWRDNDRAMPHNLYTSIERLNNYRENFYLTGGSFSQPWIFSDSPSSIDVVGYNKNEIDVNYDDVNYNVKWKYNSADSLYYRQTYENGSYQNYVDANGNWVSTKNLAVQYATTDSFTELSQTNGNALLCRGGECVNGLWRKDNIDSNVKFYIKSTNAEFEFKTGKLWINVTNNEPAAIYTISGTIKYYDGVKVISSATVILENGVGVQIATTTTDANGVYQFSNLTNGGDYVVKVNKDSDHSITGVNATDALRIKRFVLTPDTYPLDSIYKKISADVDSNSSINATDALRIKRFVLTPDTYPFAKVWKFFSTIPSIDNYTIIDTTIRYTNLNTDMVNQNFTGVKIGDVDNTWNL